MVVEGFVSAQGIFGSESRLLIGLSISIVEEEESEDENKTCCRRWVVISNSDGSVRLGLLLKS